MFDSQRVTIHKVRVLVCNGMHWSFLVTISHLLNQQNLGLSKTLAPTPEPLNTAVKCYQMMVHPNSDTPLVTFDTVHSTMWLRGYRGMNSTRGLKYPISTLKECDPTQSNNIPLIPKQISAFQTSTFVPSELPWLNAPGLAMAQAGKMTTWQPKLRYFLRSALIKPLAFHDFHKHSYRNLLHNWWIHVNPKPQPNTVRRFVMLCKSWVTDLSSTMSWGKVVDAHD